MPRPLIKLYSFVKRDFLLSLRYPLSFLLSWLGLIIGVLNFYFISKFIAAQENVPALEQYGGDYFSFVLVGLAFIMFLGPAMTGLSEAMRGEQVMGTLEAILVRPISIATLIVSIPFYGFLFSLIRCVLIVIMGIFLGAEFVRVDIILLLLILIPSIISLISIGIVSTSFIIVFKRGDPLGFVLGGLLPFLGGFLFPVHLFPSQIQFISRLIPITYSLRALRYLLLTDMPISFIWSDIMALLCFCLVLFPFSLIVFRFALSKAARDGSLSKY
ncbi:MAG: ABC transporter permease [Candidatus Omnitrophota bacterium]